MMIEWNIVCVDRGNETRELKIRSQRIKMKKTERKAYQGQIREEKKNKINTVFHQQRQINGSTVLMQEETE